MSWFLFAAAGTAIFGLVALTDKYMLTHHFTDPLVYAWSTGVAAGVSTLLGAAVLIPIGAARVPTAAATLAMLVPGSLLFLAAFAYMRAMSTGAATVVVAYSQLTPMFAFVLGLWVLSERLSATQVTGMLLVIVGAVSLAVGGPRLAREQRGRLLRATLSTALPLMVLSCLFRATSDLLMKQRTLDWGVLSAYLISRQGILLTALLLLFNRRLRQRIVAGLRTTTATSWLYLSLVEIAAIVSFFFLAVALNRGPLALVSLISSNVAVFTLVYAVLFGTVLRVPNVPTIGIRWQRLVAGLMLMAVGTAAISSLI